MSESYGAWRHREWAEAGLKDFSEFADCIEYVDQRDYGDLVVGWWWHFDSSSRVVYSGSFGNDNSPGASHYTYAEAYDDKCELDAALAHWKSKPEYLEVEMDDDLEGADVCAECGACCNPETGECDGCAFLEEDDDDED